MEHVTASALVTSISTFFLACFIISRDFKNKLYAVFALYSLSISLWSFFLFINIYVKNYKVSLFAAHLLHVPATFIPILFVHYVNIFLGDNSKKFHAKWIVCSYIVGIIITPLTMTNLIVNEVAPKFGLRHYTVAGSNLYYFYVAFWITNAVYGLLRLGSAYTKSEGARRNQLRYLFYGSLIGYAGGSDNFLLVYNYAILPFFPYGDYAIPLYVFSTTYAIIAHKLMDIEVIIRRTAVFTGLFAFVYGVFSIVTVLGQEFFKSRLGWNQWLALVPTVVIITFALRPLETWLTNATERYLFQKKYDYRELLRTFTNEILTVLDLNKLTEQTVAGLIKIIKLESAAVLLLDKDTKTYRMVAASGVKEKEIIFKENDLIISYLKQTSQHILKDKTVDKIEGDGELKNTFKRLNARICLPIELHDNLIGILSLGMKKSGEDFAQEDIDILNTLVRTEAIAISNAQLFDELSKTQAEAAQREKMAVIGTLAAGINHEICNPLGIVRGQCEMFLLNQRDGFYKQKSTEDILKISSDIMNKVINETDRATGITKKLSSFAKPSKQSDLEEVQVEKEVDEVIGLIGHDLKLNNIDIQKDFPSNFPIILADKKQIQEVFFNIIRNAAQAMDKKEGKITVSGSSDNGSAVIRIADNGSGIPQDKIGQIFNPFYTTKAPGKGTGLGLFIVKQVIEKNKGTIALESEVGVGTTFTLRFPAAVAAIAA